MAELMPNPSAAGLLTEKFARARQVLPLEFNREGALVLAMVNPSDVLTIDDVRLITGLKVVPVVTTSGALNEALDIVYSRRGPLESPAKQEEKQRGRAIARWPSTTPWFRLVDEILAAGMRQKASDIHFEPQADKMVVRLRVDGVLHPLTEIRKEIKDGVVSRIKILADMDIAEKRLPQDGRATLPGRRSVDGPPYRDNPHRLRGERHHPAARRQDVQHHSRATGDGRA